VLLFADWFSADGASRSGWSSLGWALVALLAILMAVAATVVVSTIVRAKPAIIVGSAAITAALGIVVLLIALVRVLLTQPDLDLGLGNTAVGIEPAGYLGLIALAATAAGGWTTLAQTPARAPTRPRLRAPFRAPEIPPVARVDSRRPVSPGEETPWMSTA
jgi:hypothetical protein